MLIYINGDSFASGSELCDTKYFKDAPGVITPEVQASVKKKWLVVRNKLFETVDWEKLIIDERKESWAQILCDKLGATCMNGAMGGSSMMGILIRTTNDLLTLKKQGKIPDCVFIQLTGTNRTCIFNEKSSRMKPHMVVDDAIVSILDHRKKGDPIISYMSEWIMAENEDDRGLRWLHLVYQISTTVEALIGKKPIFVDSVFGQYDFNKAIDTARKNSTSKLILDELDNLLEPTLAMYTYYKVEDGLHPLNHYPKVVHERFAQALYDIYFKDKL